MLFCVVSIFGIRFAFELAFLMCEKSKKPRKFSTIPNRPLGLLGGHLSEANISVTHRYAVLVVQSHMST